MFGQMFARIGTINDRIREQMADSGPKSVFARNVFWKRHRLLKTEGVSHLVGPGGPFPHSVVLSCLLASPPALAARCATNSYCRASRGKNFTDGSERSCVDAFAGIFLHTMAKAKFGPSSTKFGPSSTTCADVQPNLVASGPKLAECLLDLD